jgi:anti-sigma factor RsiW
MNCQDYIELIARKLEGSLSAGEVSGLASHLATCARCRAEAVLQTGIAGALVWQGEPELAADFAERVSRRALALPRAEKPARRWDYLMPIAATASLLVLVVIHRGDIAATLASPLAAVGKGTASAAGWIGAMFAEMSGVAGSADIPAASLIGLWGPLVCAAAIVVWASSRVYAVIRR